MKYICLGNCEIIKAEDVKYTIFEKDGIEYIHIGFHNQSPNTLPIAITKKHNDFKCIYKYPHNNDNINDLEPCLAIYSIMNNRVYHGKPHGITPVIFQLHADENKILVTENDNVRYTVFICNHEHNN